MSVPFAFVHHANQYLITEGYENRPGLKAILGSPCANIGLERVLHLHRVYRIPANIHVSGTLLEAIAWHVPAFLDDISKLRAGIGHYALQRVVAEDIRQKLFPTQGSGRRNRLGRLNPIGDELNSAGQR
jgi:hypothetical protein